MADIFTCVSAPNQKTVGYDTIETTANLRFYRGRLEQMLLITHNGPDGRPTSQDQVWQPVPTVDE